VTEGRIIATCGHKVVNMDDIVDVRYRSEDCDAVEGFRPCVVYASYCKPCAEKLKSDPDYIGTDEDEEAWLGR
jgi:hypothetical protein